MKHVLAAIREFVVRYLEVFKASWAARATLDPPFRSADELAFLPAHLELTDTPVSPVSRWIMRTIMAIFCVALVWACLGKLDVVAVAPGKTMVNSLIVAGVIALSTVMFATLAGFAFAKLRFKGRNILLMLVIGTMMVPPQLGVVPLFMMMSELGWSQQLPAVIFPTLVSAVGDRPYDLLIEGLDSTAETLDQHDRLAASMPLVRGFLDEAAA